MQIAYRVDLDCVSDPSILKSREWAIGDKFVLKSLSHLDLDELVVRTVVAILTQYKPNVPYPAVMAGDMYLIADGLVISSDKAVKVA